MACRTAMPSCWPVAPRLKVRRGGAFAYFPALDGSHPLETLVAFGRRCWTLRLARRLHSTRLGRAAFELLPSDLYQRGHAAQCRHRGASQGGGDVRGRRGGHGLDRHAVPATSSRQQCRAVSPQIGRRAGAGRPGTPWPGIAAMNLVVPQCLKPPAGARLRPGRLCQRPAAAAGLGQHACPSCPAHVASYATTLLHRPPPARPSPARAAPEAALGRGTCCEGAVLVPPLRATASCAAATRGICRPRCSARKTEPARRFADHRPAMGVPCWVAAKRS